MVRGTRCRRNIFHVRGTRGMLGGRFGSSTRCHAAAFFRSSMRAPSIARGEVASAMRGSIAAPQHAPAFGGAPDLAAEPNSLVVVSLRIDLRFNSAYCCLRFRIAVSGMKGFVGDTEVALHSISSSILESTNECVPSGQRAHACCRASITSTPYSGSLRTACASLLCPRLGFTPLGAGSAACPPRRAAVSPAQFEPSSSAARVVFHSAVAVTHHEELAVRISAARARRRGGRSARPASQHAPNRNCRTTAAERVRPRDAGQCSRARCARAPTAANRSLARRAAIQSCSAHAEALCAMDSVSESRRRGLEAMPAGELRASLRL